MASSGDGLTVDGVDVLGSVRSGFTCPGVAAAPGSGGGTVCAIALPHRSDTAATQADDSFGFMAHPRAVALTLARSDANTVPNAHDNAHSCSSGPKRARRVSEN